jgi:hypothetical protein
VVEAVTGELSETDDDALAAPEVPDPTGADEQPPADNAAARRITVATELPGVVRDSHRGWSRATRRRYEPKPRIS